MKYITYLNPAGLADIRLFSDMEEHKKIAEEMQVHQPLELLGAGFVINSKCIGVSESLNIESRGDDDTTILNRLTKEALKC